MARLATVPDLEVIWRPITSDDSYARLQGLLDRASSLLLQQAPHIPTRIANFTIDPTLPGALDPVVVSTVVVQIVKRYLVNPNGVSATTTGPFSASFVDRYEGKDGSAAIRGGLSVTRSDLDALRPYVSPADRVGSIRLGMGLGPQRYAGGYVSEPLEALQADPDSWPVGADGLVADTGNPGSLDLPALVRGPDAPDS